MLKKGKASLRVWLGACVLGFGVSVAVLADISLPTVTKVYFEGKTGPVHTQVDFTVRCFGYQAWPPSDPPRAPGSYKPVVVFSFSSKCPDYGCEIHEPYYLNYRHIDWCDLEGRIAGRAFKIERYGALPVDLKKCKQLSLADPRRCELRMKIPD